MAIPQSPASPLFLREAEVRRGLELLLFGYGGLLRTIDGPLAQAKLGRAHHRALYFIARKPDLTIGALIGLLGITKQSLSRVLADLEARALVETRVGRDDRRQRLLRLTPAGKAVEAELFEALRGALSQAYVEAGPAAVGGFWRVLEALIPAGERDRAASLPTS